MCGIAVPPKNAGIGVAVWRRADANVRFRPEVGIRGQGRPMKIIAALCAVVLIPGCVATPRGTAAGTPANERLIAEADAARNAAAQASAAAKSNPTSANVQQYQQTAADSAAAAANAAAAILAEEKEPP